MHRIMVVDDEVIISAQLERRLSLMGYSVVGKATSGERSIAMAQTLHPDLVLMDIVMPGGMDGIEAAGRIREEMDIPVIFVTAYADDQYLFRAKQARPYGYIVKPFHEKEVRAVIEIALHQKEMERLLSRRLDQLSAVVDIFNDAVVCLDGAGRIAVWNRRTQELSGYPAAEAVGKMFSLFLAGEGKTLLMGSIFPDGGNALPANEWLRFPGCRLARKDGEERTLDLVFFSHHDGEEQFVVCLMREQGAELPSTPGKLDSIVPVCSYCCRVRDDNGEWRPMPDYLAEQWGIRLSHGICPTCLATYYPTITQS